MMIKLELKAQDVYRFDLRRSKVRLTERREGRRLLKQREK